MNSGKKNFCIISLIFFVLMSLAFCLIGLKTLHHQQTAFDIHVFEWLKTKTNERATAFMKSVTFFGSSYFLFPCYSLIVIYFLFIRKKLWFSVMIALTGFLGNQLLYLMQDTFHRHRPYDQLIITVEGFGYPSGHSFASFTFAGLIIYLLCLTSYKKIWKLLIAFLLFCLAMLIAISRVYLRVHYATDVLGGFLLSMAWLMICLTLLNLIHKKKLST